jgi:hypothetical protein
MAWMRTHTKRRRQTLAGIQHLWGFDNGHMASLVPDAEAPGLWELTMFNSNGTAGPTVPIRPASIGALRPLDVRRILRQIETIN